MTENEKNASIEFILSKGLVKPQSVFERIAKMQSVLGFRFLFWDLGYSLVFTLVSVIGMFYLLLPAAEEFAYSAAFGFSPVLFLLIMFFSEMSERACSIYELKQTCKFTSRHVSALRVVFYSGLGIVFVVMVALASAENASQFLRVLPLCFAGLFFCAVAALSLLRLAGRRWAIGAFFASWILANSALSFVLWERWERFLAEIPPVLAVLIAVVCAATFLQQTKKMLMEENYYVTA